MMSGFVLAIRLVLLVVFGVAGIAKLLDQDGARAALEGFGMPSRAAAIGRVVLPVLELLIA